MISILRASSGDAEQLTQITIAAKRHWDYPEKWMKLWLPALTISPEYISENETWMAVEDENPIAYYSLKLHRVVARAFLARSNPQHGNGLLRREERPPRNDGDYLWLDNLWVLPEFMGRGIGQQLFQHALERCRSRGISILKIEADPNAQSFYEKMGARQIDEHHSEVDGQPRVLPVMEIDISSRLDSPNDK